MRNVSSTTINARDHSFPNGTSVSQWGNWLALFHASAIINLIAVAWVFGCLVFYGFKTRRWCNTRGKSSLSNGAIYITCAFAVVLIFPKLITTLMLHVLRSVPHNENRCERIGDLSSITYTVSTYGIYTYLWLRQRYIYTNPYVKPRISKCMQWTSRLCIVYVTVISATVPVLYILPESFREGPDGCYYHVSGDEGFLQSDGSNVLFATILLTMQISLLVISVYPALRVSFNTTAEHDGSDEICKSDDEDNTTSGLCCSKFASLAGAKRLTSPIQMAVRRTVICSSVILINDVVVALVEDYVIPDHTPTVIGETLYDISFVINAICMLGSFGFAGDILTLCCPTMKIFHAQKNSRFSDASNRANTV